MRHLYHSISFMVHVAYFVLQINDAHVTLCTIKVIYFYLFFFFFFFFFAIFTQERGKKDSNYSRGLFCFTN
jgi:hypothetical protein